MAGAPRTPDGKINMTGPVPTLNGKPEVNVDTSLFKKFKINERWNLQLRTEVFNLLNHTNFAHPTEINFSGNQISSSAGALTYTATSSRQIQFALKLLF